MIIKIKGVELHLKFNMAGLEALLGFSSTSGEAGSSYRVVWGGIVGGLIGKSSIITKEDITIFSGEEKIVISIDDVIDFVDTAYLNNDAILSDIIKLLTESNNYKNFLQKKTTKKAK